MKPKSALLQAHTPFYYPEFTNELHYEAELVLRVCKNGCVFLLLLNITGMSCNASYGLRNTNKPR